MTKSPPGHANHRNQLRRSRDQSISLNLDLAEGDSIQETISRESGLFIVSTEKIFRIRTPNDIDPKLEHSDAPWVQSLYLPHGSSDPFVARTIIQTMRLAEIFFGPRSDVYISLVDISWEMMNSLIFLRLIKERMETQIVNICSEIESNIEKYTKGKSPNPLPILEYFDIEFRSFTNEVRRSLSKISELFVVLINKDFGEGHFHKAQVWAEKDRGKDSLLAQMLKNDQVWIKTWIDIRIAIEHPQRDRFVETENFALEANRAVRLPTWRFVHPDYDMARPQNLLDVFEICINNLLKFYEDLQIALADGHLPTQIKVITEELPPEQRDKVVPVRYRFHPTIQ